ncbi:hypothetical protein H920_06738 [Fukomys damarensis]|uniref:Uncharacterized protein n=1 Tax=Fukomys damarensis TaxID=885580 RepID=A0A091DL84_FUKDA|nr:hypothetical protein H920_06738 [Fukomys damarensis]
MPDHPVTFSALSHLGTVACSFGRDAHVANFQAGPEEDAGGQQRGLTQLNHGLCVSNADSSHSKALRGLARLPLIAAVNVLVLTEPQPFFTSTSTTGVRRMTGSKRSGAWLGKRKRITSGSGSAGGRDPPAWLTR